MKFTFPCNTFIIAILICTLSGCSYPVVEHWTGSEFTACDHYYGIDGSPIDEFEYGQQRDDSRFYSSRIEVSDGTYSGYILPNNKRVLLKEGELEVINNFQENELWAKSDMITYIPNQKTNIFTEHIINQLSTATSRNPFKYLFHPSIKLPWFNKRFVNYAIDEEDILSKYLSPATQFPHEIIIKPGNEISIHAFEKRKYRELEKQRSLQSNGRPYVYTLENKEIDVDQFYDLFYDLNYDKEYYSVDNINYASLIIRERQDTIDIDNFLLRFNKSTQLNIDKSAPIFIYYLDKTFKNGTIAPEEIYANINFKKLRDKHPNYQYVFAYDRLFTGVIYQKINAPHIGQDVLSIIDKEISLLETEHVNWIVILPDGRVRIHYGRHCNFINMLNEMNDEKKHMGSRE